MDQDADDIRELKKSARLASLPVATPHLPHPGSDLLCLPNGCDHARKGRHHPMACRDRSGGRAVWSCHRRPAPGSRREPNQRNFALRTCVSHRYADGSGQGLTRVYGPLEIAGQAVKTGLDRRLASPCRSGSRRLARESCGASKIQGCLKAPIF